MSIALTATLLFSNRQYEMADTIFSSNVGGGGENLKQKRNVYTRYQNMTVLTKLIRVLRLDWNLKINMKIPQKSKSRRLAEMNEGFFPEPLNFGSRPDFVCKMVLDVNIQSSGINNFLFFNLSIGAYYSFSDRYSRNFLLKSEDSL